MQLAASERTQRLLTWIIPPFMLFIAFVIVLVNKNQTAIITRTNQEFISQQQSQLDNSQFIQYLTNHPKELQLIQTAVPNEQMMVGLLEDLEQAVRTYDPAASVSFVGTSPVKSGADMVIPVVIKVSAPFEKLPELLITIRSLPYLLQLTSIESNKTENGGEHVLGYKLFVQEPFTGL